MMGGALVPDKLHAKVALEAIVCATQLDGLTVVTVNGKEAMHDVHMFGANPKWTPNLRVWGEGAIVTVGKDSKTGDKGTRMMFVGYAEQESDSVHMWDPSTMRIVVTHDVIWLMKLYFQPDDVTGVLKLDMAEGLDDSSKSNTQVNALNLSSWEANSHGVTLL